MLGFRVWCKRHNWFMENREFYLNQDGDLRSHCKNEHKDMAQYIPMQSTGLTDKNKKMIYVGDIVEYTYVDHNDCGFKKTKLLLIDELPYGISDLYSFPDHDIIDRWYTIVGNRFEHPELLQKITCASS